MSLHTSAAALPLLLFFIGFACLMVTNAATNVPGKIVYAAPLNDSDSPASPFQDLFPIDSDLSGVGLSSKVLPQSAPGACDAAVIRKETRDKIIAECFSTEVEQKLTICRPSCMAAVRSYWFGFNGVASLCKGVVVAKRKDGEGNPTGGEVTADNLGGFILTAMTMQCVYDYIPSQCGDYPGIGLDLNSVHARMGSAWPQSTAGHSGIHKENYENFKLAACEFVGYFHPFER